MTYPGISTVQGFRRSVYAHRPSCVHRTLAKSEDRDPRVAVENGIHDAVETAVESDFPWSARSGSLLTPDDHEAMFESMVAVVEAFDLLGSVA